LIGSFSSDIAPARYRPPVRVETVLLDTIDGETLEGDLSLPTRLAPGVVVAHPHPRYGGDRHSPVVQALFDGLSAAGVAVLRFDFRGVGRSTGEHDGGAGERLDVAAAVEQLEPYVGDHPLVLAGYSFGANVVLDVADPRVSGWFALAPPLAALPTAPIAATDHRPKHLMVPEHDQITPIDEARHLAAEWPATTIEVVAMADHFLIGRSAVVAGAALAFVRSLAQ
jgi:alpha/beta superfamily hydrolase